MNAGALDVQPIIDLASTAGLPLAMIEAFYPGPYGGTALAEAIFGVQNRWGRLPYSIYHSAFTDASPMTEHDLRVAPGKTYRYALSA